MNENFCLFERMIRAEAQGCTGGGQTPKTCFWEAQPQQIAKNRLKPSEFQGFCHFFSFSREQGEAADFWIYLDSLGSRVFYKLYSTMNTRNE